MRYRDATVAAVLALVLGVGWLALAPLPTGSRELVFLIPPGASPSSSRPSRRSAWSACGGG